MRRALLALVVTAAAVVLLARYDTRPPRTLNPHARAAATPRAIARPTPQVAFATQSLRRRARLRPAPGPAPRSTAARPAPPPAPLAGPRRRRGSRRSAAR